MVKNIIKLFWQQTKNFKNKKNNSTFTQVFVNTTQGANYRQKPL